MRKDVSSVAPRAERAISKRQQVIEVYNAGGCGHLNRAICTGKTRTSTRHPAMEAVISFLQTYGRPRQMTFDRDPRSRWWQYWARFSFSLTPTLASRWVSNPIFVPRIGPTRTRISNDITDPTDRSASSGISQPRCRR